MKEKNWKCKALKSVKSTFIRNYSRNRLENEAQWEGWRWGRSVSFVSFLVCRNRWSIELQNLRISSRLKHAKSLKRFVYLSSCLFTVRFCNLLLRGTRIIYLRIATDFIENLLTFNQVCWCCSLWSQLSAQRSKLFWVLFALDFEVKRWKEINFLMAWNERRFQWTKVEEVSASEAACSQRQVSYANMKIVPNVSLLNKKEIHRKFSFD